jgi:hypothetical protein
MLMNGMVPGFISGAGCSLKETVLELAAGHTGPGGQYLRLHEVPVYPMLLPNKYFWLTIAVVLPEVKSADALGRLFKAEMADFVKL